MKVTNHQFLPTEIKRQIKASYKEICPLCGSLSSLIIHHIDGDPSNNEENNLTVMCQKCHHKCHHKTYSHKIPIEVNKDIVFRVDAKEKEKIEVEAKKLGISVSAFIRLLIRNWSNGIKFEKERNAPS